MHSVSLIGRSVPVFSAGSVPYSYLSQFAVGSGDRWQQALRGRLWAGVGNTVVGLAAASIATVLVAGKCKGGRRLDDTRDPLVYPGRQFVPLFLPDTSSRVHRKAR